MHARYAGRCENFSECHTHIQAGDRIFFQDGHTFCEECGKLEEEA